MKTVVIAGRLGKDAELRRTQGGDPVLGFSVAVDDGYGDNKRTLWFRCSMWGKRAQSLDGHLTKGSAVTVAGDLSTDEYEGKTNLTIRVSELTMQGGGEKREAKPRQQAMYGDDDPRPGSRAALDDDPDSIPF